MIALGVGFVLFLLSLAAARGRGRKFGSDSGGRRASASILWIMVQGIGIGIAGFGPVRPLLDPWSPLALGEMGIVGLLMGGAALLFDWSSRTMGKNWALVARTRNDATLVTTGPFALVRNPIYVALAMIMLAVAIAYGHVANLVVAVPVFALGTWMRVRHEEAVLRAEFGPAYDAYAGRVNRFVPGLF
jgi:protein-S-isoprenylcysteine O-methyltransferase Ste14